ncbi:MAG: IS3 family transposase [Solirubrobacteraceae bacterium]
MLRFSEGCPRWGYCRAYHDLCQLGWSVNCKRVQRLWREDGLRVPQRRCGVGAWASRRSLRSASRPPFRCRAIAFSSVS